jgi:hypothetical protein
MDFRTSKTFELESDSFASKIRLPDLPVDVIAFLKTLESGFGHLNLTSSTFLTFGKALGQAQGLVKESCL